MEVRIPRMSGMDDGHTACVAPDCQNRFASANHLQAVLGGRTLVPEQ
jgi:hypothetical protein